MLLYKHHDKNRNCLSYQSQSITERRHGRSPSPELKHREPRSPSGSLSYFSYIAPARPGLGMAPPTVGGPSYVIERLRLRSLRHIHRQI